MRVRQILDAGGVQTADDFYHAAMVFQHGTDVADYLLAHALAVSALAQGKVEAGWLVAASLDRYLRSIKQPQIYGTQFYTPNGQGTTQEPFDRQLLPDMVRQSVGVPPLAEQEIRRQEIERRYRGRPPRQP